MDQKTMTLKCIRCGGQQRMIDMVMDASGRGMACRPCAGLAPKKVDTPFGRAEPRQATRKVQDGARQRYTCTDCKYRFMSSKPLTGLVCPYCGGRRIATAKETSANALLSASLDRRYEF